MNMIETFFTEYASASTKGNAQQVAKFYAQNFIFATKDGSATFKNDQKFIEWLNGVFQFNQKTGLQKMEVKKVDSRPIGSYFFEATVTWIAFFAKKPDKGITFDLHYILSHMDDELKIVLYISDEDQEELMKKEGLI